jgi:hypothetical protein
MAHKGRSRDSPSDRGWYAGPFNLDPAKYLCSFHPNHAGTGRAIDGRYSHSDPFGDGIN